MASIFSNGYASGSSDTMGSTSQPPVPEWQVVGEQKDSFLCGLLVRNLNRAPAAERFISNACGFYIAPGNPEQIRRANWTALDPAEHMRWIWKIDVYMRASPAKYESFDQLSFEQWSKWYEDFSAWGKTKPSLSKSVFDIDGDLKPDVVLKFSNMAMGECNQHLAHQPIFNAGGSLFVLDGSTGEPILPKRKTLPSTTRSDVIFVEARGDTPYVVRGQGGNSASISVSKALGPGYPIQFQVCSLELRGETPPQFEQPSDEVMQLKPKTADYLK